MADRGAAAEAAEAAAPRAAVAATAATGEAAKSPKKGEEQAAAEKGLLAGVIGVFGEDVAAPRKQRGEAATTCCLHGAAARLRNVRATAMLPRQKKVRRSSE